LLTGRFHAIGRENFWGLVKRQLKGAYISVKPFQHLGYLDEQAFRCSFRSLGHDEHLLWHTLPRIVLQSQGEGGYATPVE
jgi:hypothetical protein